MTNKFLLPLLSFAFVLFTTTLNAQAVTSADFNLLGAKADTLLTDAIFHGEHVGLTAGIFADGQVAWTGGAGYRDLKANTPATPDMVTRIASISKSMTAVAIMQLVEKGKVDLDASLQTYVTEFPQKPEGKITIRQLLTHTAGIAHYKGLLDGFSTKEFPTLTDAMQRFIKRDLKGTPGKIYHYSTYGYVLLGIVIERTSGMEYEAYMKKHIWDVAGMGLTSVEHADEVVANKSLFYKFSKKGALKKDINSNLSMKVPGGGIQSTAADLLRFGQALFEYKLLSRETIEELFYDPGIKEWGNANIIGFFLYADDERGRIIGHSGAQVGCATQMMILLDQGIVVSCLSNTRNQGGLIHNMAWQLIDLAINEAARKAPLKRAIAATPSQLDRFVGTYDFGKGQLLTISHDGKNLYSRMNDNPTIKLFVQNESTIFYRRFNTWLSFEFNGNEVAQMTYNQNGEEFKPKKVE